MAYEIEAKAAKDLAAFAGSRLVSHSRGTARARSGFAAAGKRDLAIRVPDRSDIQAVIKDTAEPAELVAGRIRLPVGAELIDVLFALSGPNDERVPIELFNDREPRCRREWLGQRCGIQVGSPATSEQEPRRR